MLDPKKTRRFPLGILGAACLSVAVGTISFLDKPLVQRYSIRPNVSEGLSKGLIKKPWPVFERARWNPCYRHALEHRRLENYAKHSYTKQYNAAAQAMVMAREVGQDVLPASDGLRTIRGGVVALQS